MRLPLGAQPLTLPLTIFRWGASFVPITAWAMVPRRLSPSHRRKGEQYPGFSLVNPLLYAPEDELDELLGGGVELARQNHLARAC